MATARSIVFERPGVPLALRTAEVRPPGAGEMLVRVTLAGICGTDAHRLGGDLAAPPAPVCLGHEAVGMIEALGDDDTHDRAGTPLAVGDRFYWHPPTTCGECRACVVDVYPVACEKLVWPAPLMFMYPKWAIDGGVWWQYLFPLAVVTGLGGLWMIRGWS
ncbi:MAG: alcohol dehydrogenase catalytic domain-containing protein, partial [Actinomycetota bacterium]